MGLLKKRAFLPAFFLELNGRPPHGEDLTMVPREIVERVRAIADPILISEGMELVEVEYRREARGWVLRLTIDKEGGVTLDDCGRISQAVGRVLDVEDLISAPYVLEVSSPGLTRPLRTEKDFLRQRHRLIKVRTVDPINNRLQFKGRLLRVLNRQIELETEEGIVAIPLSKVAKANLEIEF